MCAVALCMFIYLILFFIFVCVKSLCSRENSAETRSVKQLFAMTKSIGNRFEFYFRLPWTISIEQTFSPIPYL